LEGGHLSADGEALSEQLAECSNQLTTIPFEHRRRWYAVHTKPCHEKRVAEHLQIRDIGRFLPLYRSTRRWNNGCRVTLEKPLFPGYMFVNINANERVRVLELLGVISIVGAGRQAMPLPDTDIERLRKGLPLVNAKPHPVLTVGERVRICGGPLEGVDGIVIRIKNQFRVVLTMELIMRSVAVEVCVDDLKPIHRSTGAEMVSCRSGV